MGGNLVKSCLTQGKTSSSKGGLVIYIDDQYKADVVINLNSYEHWEGLIIKVNGGNLLKTLNIGNIYRPPKMLNEQINAFTTEFSSVVASLTNSNNELIIAGDFNINLLKINEIEVNSNFFDTLISHSLYPQITLPTRFTRTNGRGDWGPLGHFLDFVKYLDSDKQDACITYHN